MEAPGSTPRQDPTDGALGPERSRLLRALFDRLPAMVAFWDAEGRNVLANDAYKEFFGFDPAQMPGVHIRDVLGEDVYRMNRPYIEAALAGREQRFERTLIDTLGGVRHTQAWYLPEVVGGSTVGFFVLVTDVTAQVEAEREARRAADQHRALARNIPGTFVLLFDPDLRYRLAEGPALADFGLTPEVIEGRRMGEPMPGRADRLRPHYRAALEGRTTTWDRRMGTRIFSLTAAPVRDSDGTVFAGMVVGTDVTAARRRELSDRVLRRIAAATADGAEVVEVARLVTDAVPELFDADSAGVARFAGGRIHLLAVNPAADVEAVFDIDPEDDSVLSRVAMTGEAGFVRYHAGSRGRARVIFATGVVAGAAAPIRVNGALWGAVGLGLRTRDHPESEVMSRLDDFAAAVATSISSSEAWDTLTVLAATDTLTGLANRRHFEEQLERAVHSGHRYGHAVSLVLFDLDNFKEVNDTYGHPAGDAVLLQVAARMATVARTGEVLARLGGDEFAVLLSHAGADEAAGAAARLRDALAAEPVGGHRITASAGVATDTGTGLDAGALMLAADRDLYRVKRARTG